MWTGAAGESTYATVVHGGSLLLGLLLLPPPLLLVLLLLPLLGEVTCLAKMESARKLLLRRELSTRVLTESEIQN